MQKIINKKNLNVLRIYIGGEARVLVVGEVGFVEIGCKLIHFNRSYEVIMVIITRSIATKATFRWLGF